MNLLSKPKIVLLGLMSHYPVAGVVWQTMHYLVGFQRLGYDVFYVEAHGRSPSMLTRVPSDDGPVLAANYIADVMSRFGLDGQWAYYSTHPHPRHFGLSELQLKELYSSAALIINLHGCHIPVSELTATNRLVYLETDPVEVEIEIYHKHQQCIDYLAPHCAFFTYGENFGNADCQVPVPEPFKFLPTRQPVIMDFWENHGWGDAATFTTIGNWRQPSRDITFKNEIYRWSKDLEFQKFIDLPGRVLQPFELALSTFNETDQQMLESKGWRVRRALDFSTDLDAYRQYVAGSRGEFTVAKDQNVRLRSGWFSDRAITYLAAGRPVIKQETGFSNTYPTGEGLFAFSTMEEILAAVDDINSDYDRHRRAALTIAREYFSYDVVLTRMLSDLGISKGTPGRAGCPQPAADVESTSAVTPTPRRGEDAAPYQDTQTVGRGGVGAEFLTEESVEGAASPSFAATCRQQEQRAGSSPQQAGSLCYPEGISRTTALPGIKTSIIIPVFNHANLTRQCLDAVFGTVRNDVEVIVVDDASTDDTPQMLAGFGNRIRVVKHAENSGFAQSCNDGAMAATASGHLVFLNNDTLPQTAWLEALEQYVGTHSTAAVIGSKLLYPNNTVQHAGVVICQDRYPRHIYTGFPADHPAVNKSRRFQIVTAACMMVRCPLFNEVGGFDTSYRNGYEDVDFCLRLGKAGHEIHYCAESVVHHFESVSPGRFKKDKDNLTLYRARWIECVQPDDLKYFIEDELLNLSYEGTFPIHLDVSPVLAVWNSNSRKSESERLLAERARQVADLTQENARLRVELGDALPKSPTLEYEVLKQKIRKSVQHTVPPEATILVVSKGDRTLLELSGRKAWHFPQTDRGSYAGHHPATSAEAISHLQAMVAKGAEYLLIPATLLWWLDHYVEFRDHLEGQFTRLSTDREICLVYCLNRRES